MSSPPGNPRRLATSDDIPRAVEKLLQWALRLIFYFVAFVLSVLAVVGITTGWAWWVNGPLALFVVIAIGGGRTCGGPCPLVFVPPEGAPPVSPGPPAKSNSESSP